MGKYEFTRAQWKAVTGGANPSSFKGGTYGNTDNRPVETVPWNDLSGDLRWLGVSKSRFGVHHDVRAS